MLLHFHESDDYNSLMGLLNPIPDSVLLQHKLNIKLGGEYLRTFMIYYLFHDRNFWYREEVTFQLVSTKDKSTAGNLTGNSLKYHALRDYN